MLALVALVILVDATPLKFSVFSVCSIARCGCHSLQALKIIRRCIEVITFYNSPAWPGTASVDRAALDVVAKQTRVNDMSSLAI
jgi:hypothetical protein